MAWDRTRGRGAAAARVQAVVLLAVGVAVALGPTRPAWAVDAPRTLDFDALSARIQDLVERVRPACVAVVEQRRGQSSSRFSAVIVSAEGHVLTAGHCVEPDSRYQVTLDDGRVLSARSLGSSPQLDCGMLKILDQVDFPWVEMGRSHELAKNEPCLSLGHPGMYDRRRGQVVRFGHIVGRNDRGHIHNTCLMEPGDSGGGLFDLDGRLIGIHAYIDRDLDENFDIPIDDFRDWWDELCTPGRFDPPWTAARFGIELKSYRASEQGAEVASVLEGSPADEAGLEAGDWITSVQEMEVNAGFPIGRVLQRMMYEPGRPTPLTVLRADQPLTLMLERNMPPRTAVSGPVLEQFAGLARAERSLAPVESALDDCVVRVESRRGDDDLGVLGTIVRRDGLIVTKASRLGQGITVRDAANRRFPAEVVGRDERNDLALLRVDAEFARAVPTGTAAERKLGTIVIVPRPGRDEGRVGVLGSAGFPSSARRSSGHLGVYPVLGDGNVVLDRLNDGAGKRAGLLAGDVILKVNEVSIRTVDQLVDEVQSYPPGSLVRLMIQRNEAEQVVEVVLGERPSRSRHAADHFPGGKSLRRAGFEEVFCHDAPTEPQECGAPVLDLQGNFLGVTIARVSRTHGYALSADVVRNFVEHTVGN